MNTTPRLSYSWLNSETDGEVGGTIQNIIIGMTDNARFPLPNPPLSVVQALLTGYQSALALAAGGGKVDIAAKNTARAALMEPMHILGGYIEETAGGLLEHLLSSNFPMQKDRARLAIQPAPSNLRLKHGKVSGSIAAHCARSPHRVMYEWQTAGGEIPGEWKNEVPTNSGSSVFAGHTPGSWLNVRTRARVPAGVGDWSSVIQIMVV